MISIILDTNVFVSGIFWTGPPYLILEAWQKQKVKLIYSIDILDEYTRVSKLLSRKYKALDIDIFIDLFKSHGELHTPVMLPERISDDPDDEKFIA